MNLSCLHPRLPFLLVTALIFPVTFSYAQQSLSLDQFLGGLDRECVESTELRAFIDHLRLQTDGGDFVLTPKAAKSKLSPSIREAVRLIPITEDAESYQVITVDLNGSWEDVAVKSLEFVLGKGSGIYQVSVIFSPPSARAISVFE